MNHSCHPNTSYHATNQGRTLVFRALRDIRAGDEVTYSYIELYQPQEVRAKLLLDAFDFKNEPPAARLNSDLLLSAGADGAPAPNAASSEASAWLEKGMEMSGRDPLAGQRCLQELLHSPVAKMLHPCHQAIYDAHLAVVAASALTKDTGAKAKHALAALQAYESVVGLGTPQLAMLYYVHGSALHSLLKENKVPQNGRPGAAKQSVAALQAAYKIQGSCYGPGHALARPS